MRRGAEVRAILRNNRRDLGDLNVSDWRQQISTMTHTTTISGEFAQNLLEFKFCSEDYRIEVLAIATHWK